MHIPTYRPFPCGTGCETEHTPEECETSWVKDPNTPKLATELVEGISARVVILDGDYSDLQAYDHLNERYTSTGKGIVLPDVEAILDRCADERVTVADGVYQVVAIGPGVHGNPLKLKDHLFYFWEAAPTVHDDVPTDRDGLKKYLSTTHTKLGFRVASGLIGGIVWHAKDGTGRMAKIRLKDL